VCRPFLTWLRQFSGFFSYRRLHSPSQRKTRSLFARVSYLRDHYSWVIRPSRPGPALAHQLRHPATVARMSNLMAGILWANTTAALRGEWVAAFDVNLMGHWTAGKNSRATFVFGPQLHYPAKVSPFAHALFGVATESQDSHRLRNLSFSSLGSDPSSQPRWELGSHVRPHDSSRFGFFSRLFKEPTCPGQRRIIRGPSAASFYISTKLCYGRQPQNTKS